MSWYQIPQKSYSDDRTTEKRPKSQMRYMKKEHFREQDKTAKHKCSQCIRTDAKKYKISGNDFRWMCPLCLAKHKRKDEPEKPHFTKASQLNQD